VSPRAIRIPRAGRAEGSTAADPRKEPPPGEGPATVRRINTAGTQRAVRLTLFYLLFLALLYVGFVLLDRAAPGGASSGAATGVDVFSVLAAALAVGGSLLSLHPAPRYLETSDDATVVVGRWGMRHEYPPIGRIETRLLRRYSAGLLSRSPVISVELSGGPSPQATFLLEEGLIPVERARR